MAVFNWEKKGRIFSPNEKLDWSKSHATLPTPVLIADDVLRIFYTSRDIEQKSRISFIDVDPDNPLGIINTNDNFVLDIGKLGMLDDRGLTSSFALPVGDKLYFYYNGYNIATPARYRVAIGLAISKNNGASFTRYSDGPVMDRSFFDPCGCATPYILFENGVYRMWYTSFIKWEMINGDAEPFYRIAYAESKDAISWHSKSVCIDLENNEGGIVRPSVQKVGDKYYMWFSVRKNTGYRDSLDASYRIGFAESENGIDWVRKDDEFNLDVSDSGWDSEMMAYPYVYNYKGRLYMFYVGNGFGKSGFGLASCIL
jgi:predicted GH43/DUF377 family glycosyl hydrolase